MNTNPTPEVEPDENIAKAAPTSGQTEYVLRLFITGTTPASSKAIVNIRKICDTYLKGQYVLDVVDISQNPEAAAKAQIIAVPTLIKQLPLPLRRFIGDMSETERMLAGLEIRKQ
ncbi:MAG TPA: circadian clock KaiB family protein [Pyrinomonadaceae bacterium]|nr:circadian clock KaiB family protein [Pyrinomonadaceae bacterium]